jgi:hypothetical protein
MWHRLHLVFVYHFGEKFSDFWIAFCLNDRMDLLKQNFANGGMQLSEVFIKLLTKQLIIKHDKKLQGQFFNGGTDIDWKGMLLAFKRYSELWERFLSNAALR